MQVQKLVYNELISNKHSYNIHETIERRPTSLFQPFTLDFNHSISLADSLRSLKGNRVADVLKVLKSWCNGWATSHRYHEDITLPCLFGCHKGVRTDLSNSSDSHRDSLSHYLQCPHLFALWKFMIPSAHEDPLIRWGLIRPCSDSYKQIACVHCGYHAVRRHYKNCHTIFHQNMTYLDGALTRTSWTVFADAFQVEASELGVQTLKFSVPSFLNFLTAGSNSSYLNDRPFVRSHDRQ